MTQPPSLQLYSVRDALDADPEGVLRRVRELGFADVELFDFVHRRDSFARSLAATGVRATCGHNTLVGDDVEPEAVFAAARQLGLHTVIEPTVRDRWSTADEIAQVAAEFNALVPLAAAHGLRIGYHNHWWEFPTIDGRTALEYFADLLDPAVVLEVDVYWAWTGGADPAVLLDRLGPRVRYLHLKDGSIQLEDGSTQLDDGSTQLDDGSESRGEASQVPLGHGVLDLPSILRAAPEAERVVELDRFAGDVFDGIAASGAYLRRVEAAA